MRYIILKVFFDHYPKTCYSSLRCIFCAFLLTIDRVMVEKEVLAKSWAIHGSNEFCFLHFKNINLLDVSLKQFYFEFLTIPRGFNLF